MESLTPYTLERLITGVKDYSSTKDAIDVNEAVDFSDASALVTDPADVARHMEAALYSCCDYWLDRIRGGKADQSFATYQRDLRMAMEQDQLAPLSGRSREIWHDGGWRSPLKADEGV
jgi:hypothetical protein